MLRVVARIVGDSFAKNVFRNIRHGGLLLTPERKQQQIVLSGSNFVNLIRQRHYWPNMQCTDLQPPDSVRGMVELNREVFRKRIKVPALCVPEEQVNRVKPILKKFLLKMERLKPVQQMEDEDEDCQESNKRSCRLFLLHPTPVRDWESLPTKELMDIGLDANCFSPHHELELSYDNWRADEILKAILPADNEALTSFSRIGHIVHINLRDHLIPYKQLIGQVLCDKVVGCRTVVNKASSIDNTYRNFEFELLYGEPNYQVETKENGTVFEFDFSRVYWNPRLSTEHERIVQMVNSGDVLYDVFAGVGPFSVPAAKKRCHVLANDLNPESFRWLQHNMKRSKCTERAKLFNKDGRDFILEDVKDDLLKRWQEQSKLKVVPDYKIHITMNLPAISVEFLPTFRHLLQPNDIENVDLDSIHCNYPLVHVYTFAKGDDTKKLALHLVEKHLGVELGANLESLHFVRNVAPNKDMFRVTFKLSKDMLISKTKTSSVVNDNDTPRCTETHSYEGEFCRRKRNMVAEQELNAEDQNSPPAKLKIS